MSTQEFNEQVGQVVQADTVTQTVTQFINDGGRSLTFQERRALNDRVKRLEGEFGEDGATVWRTTHAAIGVRNIEEMRLGHYGAAVAILDLMLECAALEQQLSQSSTQSEEGAASQAALLLQNSDLTSKLKEAQKGWRTWDLRLNEAKAAIQQLTSERDSAKENFHKAKQLLDGVSRNNLELRDSAQRARKRGNRMAFAAAASFLMMTVAIAGAIYQTRQAGAAASQCELNGKAFPVGSAMPGRLDRECARSEDGWAEWRPKQGNRR